MKYQNYFQDLKGKPLLYDSLESGSIPLLHIQNHKFRDRVKESELGKKGDIYLQHFLPAKQRALKTQKQFQSGHLKEDEFNPNLPNKNHAHWLKVRKVTSEGPPMRFGANKRTENERISDNLNEGDGYWIDHSAKDTKMVFHPDWKEIQKGKWTSVQNFDLTTVMPTGIRSDPPWEEFPTRYNHEGDEYIDGLEKVGEKMHRFRDKSKEGKRSEMICVIGEDVLGKTKHISKSLRTYKAQQVLGVDEDFDKYSKNNKLDGFYKQALIDTGSVDHAIPYMHSQSVRSLQVNNLMPVAQRTYKLSIKEMCNHQPALEDLRPQSQEGTPTANEGKASAFKDYIKEAKNITSIGKGVWVSPTSQKVSRGSMRTTAQTWNHMPRAQTAVEKTRHKHAQTANPLKVKLESDPYYQPTNQEAKELIEKYFPHKK